jgi:hypothetical protein
VAGICGAALFFLALLAFGFDPLTFGLDGFAADTLLGLLRRPLLAFGGQAPLFGALALRTLCSLSLAGLGGLAFLLCAVDALLRFTGDARFGFFPNLLVPLGLLAGAFLRLLAFALLTLARCDRLLALPEFFLLAAQLGLLPFEFFALRALLGFAALARGFDRFLLDAGLLGLPRIERRADLVAAARPAWARARACARSSTTGGLRLPAGDQRPCRRRRWRSSTARDLVGRAGAQSFRPCSVDISKTKVDVAAVMRASRSSRPSLNAAMGSNWMDSIGS